MTNAIALAFITLAWNAPSITEGIAGYRVRYGQESGVYTNRAEFGTATNATINGLVPGNVYYFAVSAIDENGLESDLSNEISYLAIAPVKPENLHLPTK